MYNSIHRSAIAAGMLLALGCSKSGNTHANDGGPATGMGPGGLPVALGKPDTSVKTALPPVPALVSVRAAAVGDSVTISVEPIQGAKDYRVYALPSDDAISTDANGLTTITNAIYRCAGYRESPTVTQDGADLKQSEAIKSIVQDAPVSGYTRSLPEATLGYVYLVPGDGRVPVYAMGDPGPRGENLCFQQRWTASRVKRYVTSEAERKDLLSKRWRDDGIVFYVPADGADGTQPVYHASGDNAELYYVDGPEAAKRSGGQPAFSVVAALPDPQPADVAPLMRVFYLGACSTGHDELVAGEARFERVRTQGDQLPMFDLHWSGITDNTTLVVEALDQGCPFQGVLAPITRDASKDDNIQYEPFSTVADLQAASPSGEVFINGQHEATNTPKAVARSFVKVSPGPKPDLDWFEGFGADETYPDFDTSTWAEPCENPDNPTCLAEYRQKSDFGELSFSSTTKNRNGIGVVNGELWVAYADVGADVGGKFRFTPNIKAKMSDTTYLHVTMEVDAYTTARRYPQMIISDGANPVQWTLPKSNAIILEPFRDDGTANWPYVLEFQVCDHRKWEVNDHCPTADIFRRHDAGNVTEVAPIAELAEQTGVDLSAHFDAFFSTKRAYLFTNNQPTACLDMPAAGIPSGDVSVSFGDVLYHSDADVVANFHLQHQKYITKRHFDNLGFKSGVEGPAWDEALLPCVAASTFKQGL